MVVISLYRSTNSSGVIGPSGWNHWATPVHMVITAVLASRG
jgi:hypothetical protein